MDKLHCIVYWVVFLAFVMNFPVPPTLDKIDDIIRQTTAALAARMHVDDDNLANIQYYPKICSVCDSMATVDNPMIPMYVSTLKIMCHQATASKVDVLKVYNMPTPELSACVERMLSSYTCDHHDLKDYVLSPSSRTFTENGIDMIEVCTTCHEQIKESLRHKKRKQQGPANALWNGSATGQPPSELSDLNIAEMAILSPNRIKSHAAVLYADQHQGVYGWHSMYENNVDNNLANIQQLVDAGLKGEIMVVLCGPWDETQKSLAKNRYTVRPEKIMAAFAWLKKNNHYYTDLEIPDIADLPLPIIVKDKDS